MIIIELLTTLPVFFILVRSHQHDVWHDGQFFRINDIRSEELRGEVRYVTEYSGDDLWNITMRVQHPIKNFNPQQTKLHVRNITENESIFVMVPYDQDRIVSADKPAKFGFQGMWDPKLVALGDGTFNLPKLELIWMMSTENETVFYDSEVGYTPPEEKVETTTQTTESDNQIPTVSLVGETEELNSTTNGTETETSKRPFGWSAPEPDYVKFELPFNSPHGSKFTGFKFNYGDALKKSIIFFEAQRSGVLPETNRIPWRGDSFILDRGSMKEDLSRGYFDAGDHLKFTLPMAFSMTLLSWSLLQYWDVYDAIGELDNVLDTVKWGLEWLVRANPRQNELYALVGDPKIDHDYWGRPENFTAHRPTFKITTGSPGSDVAGEVAAAMAAGSLALRKWGDETSYPGNLAKRAELLYAFANEHRRHYHLSVPAAAKHYKSSGYKDELVWAATWVYRATGKEQYLLKARKHYGEYGMKNTPMGFRFSWDDKTVGTSILLAQVDEERRAVYMDAVEQYCSDIQSNKKVLYTPARLLYLDEWGPIRYAMNSASVCLMASDLTTDLHAAKRYHNWAQSQVDYVLGAKSNGYSYMVGYGTKYPRRPHHRAASCPTDMSKVCDYSFALEKDDNPTVHWGAVVGGPDRHDGFKDDRLYYKQSEVALDFNAGFQLATTGVMYHKLFGMAREIYQMTPEVVSTPVFNTTASPITVQSSALACSLSFIFILFV